MNDAGENVEVIDLTGGISASTSPMFSPQLSSRLRSGAAARVLYLAEDSSEGEEKKEEVVSPPEKKRLRRSRRMKVKVVDDDDDGAKKNASRKGDDVLEGGEKPVSRKVARTHRSRKEPEFQDSSDSAQRGQTLFQAEEDCISGNKKIFKAAVPLPLPSTRISKPKEIDLKKQVQAYLKSRRASVKKRYFDLTQIPTSEVIPTGRTIKQMGSWSGHWPALREFLQNTVDHLGLLDPKTGRRHGALQLEATPGGSSGELATIRFVCADEAICTIVASEDELVIEQRYTFPIAPRALDTGVPDIEKSGASSAGGFGDGFKTAAVALLAAKNSFNLLKWDFYVRGQKITWSFEGITRAAVGTFAKCQVLQVRIDRTEEISTEVEQENTMRQTIKVKGIGRSFVEQAVPRFLVFWDLNESALLLSGKSGGDFLGAGSSQPAIFCGVLGPKIRPESGVYVKGIWVRKPKIAGALMCFFGRRLEVIGRDRNDVDNDDLANAVVYVFQHCTDISYLRRLLAPLRGKAYTKKSSCSSSSSSSSLSSIDSWLLKSPRFLNQILEQYKDFILHDILGVPRGAIYISSKTIKSSDPFFKWASSFLDSSGSPLETIEPGANRYLFQEVSELELTEHCVKILEQQNNERGCNAEILSKAFRKILTFMSLGRAKLIFSAHIAVAFVHNNGIYVPDAPLTREVLVKVLNICQCHLEGANGEYFSCLMQAIFETLPPGGTRSLSINDITSVVDRAKGIRKENSDFLVKTNGKCLSSPSDARKLSPQEKTNPGIDLTENNGSINEEDVQGIEQPHSCTSTRNLKRKIAQIALAAERGCKRNQQGEATDLQPIIPEADFGQDDAGNDTCLRPSSQLQSIEVDASLGGGTLLCDARAIVAIRDRKWSATAKRRIVTLREVLQDATKIVRQSMPTIDPLLHRIRPGYDYSNDTYEAFCDGRQIIVNLHSYMPKMRSGVHGLSLPKTLVHDMVVMITHELAHFLEPQAGHGPVWRDTHMNMVAEVMTMLHSKSGRGQFGHVGGIDGNPLLV